MFQRFNQWLLPLNNNGSNSNSHSDGNADPPPLGAAAAVERVRMEQRQPFMSTTVGLEQLKKEERFSQLKLLKEAVNDVHSTYEQKHQFLESRRSTEPGMQELWLIESNDFGAEQLCVALELCLVHGLKDRGNKVRLSLWNVLFRLKSIVEPSDASASEAIQRAMMQSNVKSHEGKARAWIRIALNSSVLLHTLLLLNSPKGLEVIDSYYEVWGLVKSSDGLDVMIALVSCLKTIRFKLNANSAMLDSLDVARPLNSVPPLVRRKNSQTGSLDDIFVSMDNVMDGVAAKADAYISKASQALHNTPKGIPSWQRVFGVSLDNMIQSPYHCRYALIDPAIAVPNFVEECIQMLEKACETEHLFRKTVPQSVWIPVRTYVEKHGHLPNLVDIHCVAALFIQFFRELPQPLLTSEHHDAFVSCSKIKDEDDRVRNLGCLIEDLPWTHKPTLLRVIEFAHMLQLPEHAAKNGLNLVALSLVLSPAIVRSMKGVPFEFTDSAVQYNQEMRLAAVGSPVVECMILNHEAAFLHVKKYLVNRRKILERKMANLHHINALLNEKIDFTDETHHELMQKLWECLHAYASSSSAMEDIPAPAHKQLVDNVIQNVECDQASCHTSSCMKEENFMDINQYSTLWEEFGFNRVDISRDFEMGGVLYLRSLLYFIENHFKEATQIMIQRAPVVEMNYNFPILGGNITMLLAGILKLTITPTNSTIDMFVLSSEPFWHLLNEKNIFEKMFSFSCFLFEHNWRITRAKRKYTDNVIHDSMEQIKWLLQRAPRSMDELWQIWLENRQTHDEQVLKELNHLDALVPKSSGQSNFPTACTQADSVLPAVSENADASMVYKDSLGVTTRLLNPSRILTKSSASAIEASLPVTSQGYDWELLFSIAEHGASLQTLLLKSERKSPTLLIIRTVHQEIFGAYVSDAWHHSHHYYGTGETFLFSLRDGFQKYAWTQSNSYFMICSEQSMAVGGGKSFGIYVDEDLRCGTSGFCETFDSPPLASQEEFIVGDLEVWRFTPPTGSSVVFSIE